MKKILLALIVIIAEGVFFSLCAQSFTITGSVVDMNGETMPGVNIVEQGAANNGAISDVNGNFKITVASSKSVLISKNNSRQTTKLECNNVGIRC